jgi:exodeoxyribonuclease VII large subunit
LDLLEERLKRSLLTRLERSKNRFSRNAGLLDSLSPLKVLGRGYSMVQDPDSGKTLSKAGALALGQEIDVLMQDGKVTCQVRNRKLEDTIHTTQD